MTQVMMFSIDGGNKIHDKKKFYRYIDNLSVGYKLSDNVIPAIGCYNGVIEESFIMSVEDFNKHILGTEFVEGQESFLRVFVDSKSRMLATLVYKNGKEKLLGRLRALDKKEISPFINWTYRQDLNQYWGV